MANDITGTVWQIASDGIISSKPVRIGKILFYPNANTDVGTLQIWGPETANATARASMRGQSIQVTGTDTVISSGNFEAAEALAGDVIHFLDFDGRTSSNYNIYSQIETRSSDNQVIVDAEDALTTEAAGKIASWDIWKPSTFLDMYAPATEKMQVQYDFAGIYGRGFRVPNLKIDGLTSSAVVYIYIV